MCLNLNVFRALWNAAADDIERRFLNLPFLVEMTPAGWTTQPLSLNAIHAILHYPPNPATRKKLKAIITKYEGLGVVQTIPPGGDSRLFWFSYAVQAGDSQTLPGGEPGDSRANEQADRGDSIPAAAPHSGDSQTPAIVETGDSQIPEFAGSVTLNHQTHAPAYTRTRDLDDDDENFIIPKNQEKDHHDQQPPDPRTERAKNAMLGGIGIKPRSLTPDGRDNLTALTLAELETIISNARAGKRLHEIKKTRGISSSIAAYVVACLNNGGVATNFLDQLAALEESQKPAEEKRASHIDEIAAKYGDLVRDDTPAAPQPRQAALSVQEARLAHQLALWREANPQGLDPNDAWLATLGQLQIQLHSATYETWVEGAKLEDFEPGEVNKFTIHCRNNYAKDWLDQRLYRLAQTSLQTIFRQPVEITFTCPEPQRRELSHAV